MSWEGEVVPRVVPRPASPWLIFFSLQPHYFFFTLLLAHTKVHTDTQAGDGIWKRFPFPSNHSPLWDLSSCNPPGSTITQTLLFLTCSPRAIKPKRNPSTRISLAKGHCKVESHRGATSLPLTGMSPRLWQGAKAPEVCPYLWPAQPSCSLFQALLPSETRHFWGSQEGKWWNQQELEGFSQAGQQWEQRSTFPSLSVCWRAGLEQELAWSTARARHLPSAGRAKSRGKSACKLGTHSLLHSCEAQPSLRVQGSDTSTSRILGKVCTEHSRSQARSDSSLALTAHICNPDTTGLLCSVPSCNLKYSPGSKVSICKHRGTVVLKLQANIWLHSGQFKEYPAQTPPFCPTTQTLMSRWFSFRPYHR